MEEKKVGFWEVVNSDPYTPLWDITEDNLPDWINPVEEAVYNQFKDESYDQDKEPSLSTCRVDVIITDADWVPDFSDVKLKTILTLNPGMLIKVRNESSRDRIRLGPRVTCVGTRDDRLVMIQFDFF